MVKLVYCLRRRADISLEEFYRYWLNTHGPKVKSMAEALRARRYIQSHTCAPELNQIFAVSRGLAPAYDGITEVWWDSVEDVKAAMASAVGAEAMYWRAVSQYKATNDHTGLGEVAKELAEKFPGDEWQLKSVPWSH